MSSKRTKKRKHLNKKSNIIKPKLDPIIAYYDSLHDSMFCKEIRSTPEMDEKARNNLRKLISLQPTDNKSKLQGVVKEDLNLLMDFNDPCFDKFKNLNIEKGYTANTLRPFVLENERIMIHEEIIWLFSRNFQIQAEFKTLIYADKIKWHIENNESHKSPDLIFEFNDKRVGVEVTWTRPGMVRAKEKKL